jgi:hypothetical protein
MFRSDAIAHRSHSDRRKIDYFELTDFAFYDVAIQPVIPLGTRLMLKQPMFVGEIFFNYPPDWAIDSARGNGNKTTAYYDGL